MPETAEHSSGRLLRILGYEDNEIVDALVQKHGVTRDEACSTLQQVDQHLQDQEDSNGYSH